MEDEERRDPARAGDQVGGDPDRLVPDLRERDLGPGAVEDPFERADVVDRAADAPRLRAACTALVVAIDVTEIWDRVGRLDPAHLVLERGGRSELGDHVTEADRVGAALSQFLRRAARHGDVRDLVAAPLELLADDSVELALVGLQRGDQEAHRGQVS